VDVHGQVALDVGQWDECISLVHAAVEDTGLDAISEGFADVLWQSGEGVPVALLLLCKIGVVDL
jgi:hypothetical protein